MLGSRLPSSRKILRLDDDPKRSKIYKIYKDIQRSEDNQESANLFYKLPQTRIILLSLSQSCLEYIIDRFNYTEMSKIYNYKCQLNSQKQ